MTYPHVKGDEIAEAYGVDNSGIPTMFVIDREGRVADFFIGWNGEATAQPVSARVESLAAGKSMPAGRVDRSTRT